MFYNYIKNNQQMNLQLNRQLEGLKEDPQVKKDLANGLSKIVDLESWFSVWSSLADVRQKQGRYDIACSYYGLAQFYLSKDDRRKKNIVHLYLDNFYRSHPEIDYESFKVPYLGTYLPAVKVNVNPDAKKTLIIINGFDSFMEEILAVADFLKGSEYNAILFDGPGQGRALIDNGLKFTPYFEKPVSAVIDYFGLSEVDAMGVSWGGYFVIRAAAFEKRIKKVICFDFFYDGLNVFLKNFSEENRSLIRSLLNDQNSAALDRLVETLMETDSNISFLFNKGYENTGTDTPYELLADLSKHTIKGLGKLVDQDVLLLAGKEDQYVPFDDLKKEQAELSNAKSLETHIFTKETGGEQHCQAGRYDLALTVIKDFLKK